MRNNPILPTILIIGASLSACTTIPEQHAVLEDARTIYSAAQSDPDVTKHAAVELQQAGNALKRAESAWNGQEDSELVDHLAYLARQRALIAQDTGELRSAEIEVANAGARRDAVRLEVRTAEADAAHKQVGIAQDAVTRQAKLAAVAAVAAAHSSAELEASALRMSEMKKELADLNARKTERGHVITLGDVLFDFDKDELKSGSERNLQKIADFLQEYPERKALIEGFTDSAGSDSYNQALSERRAEAVRTFLISKGVSASRIAARGYGESNPVASNKTAETRQLNRRVEIVISDGENDIVTR